MYLAKFEPDVARLYGLDILVRVEDIDRVSKSWIMMATDIFSFKDGKTIYYKNKGQQGYQYTEEEQIILRLGGSI